MEVLPSNLEESAPFTSLKIEFSWKARKATVTDPEKPEQPVYRFDFRSWKSPHVTVNRCADDHTVATANIHAVGINPTITMEGQPLELKATRRLKEDYAYRSNLFTKDGKSQSMLWTTNWSLKNWCFTLLDEQQVPIARFNANIWALHQIGIVELIEKWAGSRDAWDEVMVTGFMTYYTLAVRSSNFLNLVGSAFYTKSKRNIDGPNDAKSISDDEDAGVSRDEKKY